MFEVVWGAEGCTDTIFFFSDFPSPPLTSDSVTPHLHTGKHLCFKLLHCIPSKLEWNSPHSQDSVLMPAADTEAMPNQVPEQSADRPQRCFSAPALMRGQKEKEQSPLTTWGGCQGIKYCSEFSMGWGMTHSSCWSTRRRGAGCRGKVSKGWAEFRPNFGVRPLLYVCCLTHALFSWGFWKVQFTLLQLSLSPASEKGLIRDIRFSWFSLCLLPVEIPRA